MARKGKHSLGSHAAMSCHVPYCLVLLIASKCISAAVAGKCKSKAASDAFAVDDISGARVALSKRHFRRSAVEEACAQKLWAAGVQSLLERGSERLGTTGRSKVEDYLNDGHGGCEVFHASEILSQLSLVMPVLPDQLAMRIYFGDRSFILEQDSFLRSGDSATVLWPAGLRLAEWLVSNCELMQGRVVELGAGLGLPSLAAAAICRDAVVTATDKEPYALLNMRFHAGVNQVKLETGLLDMSTDEHLPDIAGAGRFDVVLIADMEFLEWTETDWHRLAKLLKTSQSKVFLCLSVEDVIALLDSGRGMIGGGRFQLEPLTDLKLFKRVPVENADAEEIVEEREEFDDANVEEDDLAPDDDDAQSARPSKDGLKPESPWIVVRLHSRVESEL